MKCVMTFGRIDLAPGDVHDFDHDEATRLIDLGAADEAKADAKCKYGKKASVIPKTLVEADKPIEPVVSGEKLDEGAADGSSVAEAQA